MAQTIADISVGDTWVDLNVQSGITEGDSMTIQNKSPTWVLLHEASSAPAESSADGILLGNMEGSYAGVNISAGSLKIWAKSTITGRPAMLSVQLV